MFLQNCVLKKLKITLFLQKILFLSLKQKNVPKTCCMTLDLPIFMFFTKKNIFGSDQFFLGGYKWNHPPSKSCGQDDMFFNGGFWGHHFQNMRVKLFQGCGDQIRVNT